MLKRGELVIGGIKVGGYVVERRLDGTVRAAFWGVLALLAAQAEVDAAVRLHEPATMDAVGVEVDDLVRGNG